MFWRTVRIPSYTRSWMPLCDSANHWTDVPLEEEAAEGGGGGGGNTEGEAVGSTTPLLLLLLLILLVVMGDGVVVVVVVVEGKFSNWAFAARNSSSEMIPACCRAKSSLI